jgi:predicted unusual protein kinase regulating ubiquinone biosynthesis (AarF/ABC1/UbiB family)
MQIGKSIGTIPTDLLLVGRVLGLLDGITKQLNPSMDTMEIVAHYLHVEGTRLPDNQRGRQFYTQRLQRFTCYLLE